MATTRPDFFNSANPMMERLVQACYAKNEVEFASLLEQDPRLLLQVTDFSLEGAMEKITPWQYLLQSNAVDLLSKLDEVCEQNPNKFSYHVMQAQLDKFNSREDLLDALEIANQCIVTLQTHQTPGPA